MKQADYFKDIGTIKKVTTTKTGVSGIMVYSPKSKKMYTFGGLLNFNKKEGDKIKIIVSFNKIINIEEV
ncbi:MAG: hypothetical protein R6U36_11280 [Candidatus Fermentibacteraceae bacterium]